jgi:large subunit ribosomal protein L23
MSIRARKRIDPKVSVNKAYQVILNPLITEKATQLSEFNKVVFSVPLSANKVDIKLSVEKIYSVKVNSVNTILLKGKKKIFKGIIGRRVDTKKAIVTLAAGNTIDLSVGA